MFGLVASAAAYACLAAPLPATDLKPVGSVAYKKAIFHLYDISLCSDTGTFQWDNPFVITLKYKRKFSSEMIVKATMVEMSRLSGRDQSEFEPLRPTVDKCFPNVKKGDQITGVSMGPDEAKFYYNGELTCEVKWAGFNEDFFGIWLADESRAPRKSKVLRGLKK
ncbi:MAG: hypothetical protein HKO02_07425 [Hyphomonadaceae bacterium]|nr:hypothetical protein [Hyphomonadaceae bacterium]